jgi:hypothetical protein
VVQSDLVAAGPDQNRVGEISIWEKQEGC